MKLLFDQNLSVRLCERLSDLFPESSHVRLLGLERANDRAIWDYARVNGLTLVSLDADFAEMAVLLGSPPQVIWLRCGNQATAVVESLLRSHAAAVAEFERSDAACLEVYLVS
jgi:predicted nuclease of predicted toxin-antitoxin system